MQNLISFGGVPKIPPSELGFVCKPEMPPHINILFRSRPQMPFIPLQQRSITRHYTGIFDFNDDIMSRFEKEVKPIESKETKQMTKLKALVEKLEKQKEINKEKLKEWEPKLNPNATKDPYKTLFVYKLDPKIDEKKLQKEFEFYGEIRKVRVVRDMSGKSRGYGFIEFKHGSHFKYAKNQKEKKIMNCVVLIDYERGRIEKGWKPRRLGGGRGDNRGMPKWLVDQLEDIGKKYPDLIKEKGEISDSQWLRNKKHRSHDKNNDNGNSHRHKDKSNDKEKDNKNDEENHHENNPKRHKNNHNHDFEDDDKTDKEDNGWCNEKSPKKEYEVGEIV